MSKRILVTGSRDWEDMPTIQQVLEEYGPGVVVHGGASGADRLASSLAVEIGWGHDPHPVTSKEWREIGKRAGPLRNQRMVDLGADVCIAFPRLDSVGTYDCAARAKRAGILLVIIPHSEVDEDDIDRGMAQAERKLEREPDHEERMERLERRRTFNVAYGKLARVGACDSLGGMESERVRAEWEASGRPADVESFIRIRANIGAPDPGTPSDPAVETP